LEDGDHVLQGRLRCTRCTRDYPIIDGIPVLIAELRRWMADHLDAVMERADLDPSLAVLIGDAMGPGTLYDTRRSHLSSYGWGHWGDLDPNPPRGPGEPAGLVTALAAGLAQTGDLPVPVVLDCGCGVGRSAFELARAHDDALVLGIDLSFSFLRAAADTLRTGRARYPVRRNGIVYDTRDIDAQVMDVRDRVDFWCMDAQALPLPKGCAGGVASLNLIDCVPTPRDHLIALRDVLAPGGWAVLATPFDWSPAATELDQWIGGHAQLHALQGQPDAAFDALVGSHPFAIDGLTAIGEAVDVPWWVRLHDRSTAAYEVRVRVLQRSH